MYQQKSCMKIIPVFQIPIAEAISLSSTRDFKDSVSPVATEPFQRGSMLAEIKTLRSESCSSLPLETVGRREHHVASKSPPSLASSSSPFQTPATE